MIEIKTLVGIWMFSFTAIVFLFFVTTIGKSDKMSSKDLFTALITSAFAPFIPVIVFLVIAKGLI